MKQKLYTVCQELSKDFSDLFQPELGYLKDYKLEVKLKSDTTAIYCKPWTVPLALLGNQA